MKTRKTSIAFFMMGILALLIMVLYYNHIRILHAYAWGFLGKEYSVNLIPFMDMPRIIDLFGEKILQKVLIFAAFGIVLYFTIYQFGKVNRMLFAGCAIGIVAFLEMMQALTSSYLIVFDMNNFIIYAIGFTIGYFISLLLLFIYRKISQHVNVRIGIQRND